MSALGLAPDRTPAASAREARAPVMEVFASIQGEGQYVGQPQAFVRLAGCPLRCRWCDTPGSWTLAGEPRARIAARAGPRREAGWATPFQVATWIAAVEGAHARTVSVTGGEPLLWPDFVRALGALVTPRRVHLETAGAHPAALEQVLERVDHVSLDLKLPSDLGAPVPVAGSDEAVPSDAAGWRAVRARVLALVRGRDACGKLIVAGDRAAAEFVPLLDDVAALSPELPLFAQPVTPVAGVPAPTLELLDELCELASERGLALRVVPQVHRILGIP